MTEKEFWRERLRQRSERLAKFSALNAPTVVIVNEVLLVLKACAGLDAEATGDAIGGLLRDVARRSCDLCTVCGQEARGREVCQKCSDAIMAEDKEGP